MKIISCRNSAANQNQESAPLGAIKASDSDLNAPVGAGLVYSLTSDTPESRYHLDPRQIRLRRLRRSVVTAARLHHQALTKQKARHKVAMLTLTYCPFEDYEPRQISNLLKHIRQWLARRGHKFRFVWVMELTKAGVPHYHILIWLPKGASLPKPDKQGWWPHGSTRIEWTRNAVAYVAKYASKAENSAFQFPPNSRLHGCGGLERADRYERSWWVLPGYIRDTTPEPRDTGPSKRAKGGGWLTPFGEWIPSRFKIISFNPLTLQQVTA